MSGLQVATNPCPSSPSLAPVPVDSAVRHSLADLELHQLGESSYIDLSNSKPPIANQEHPAPRTPSILPHAENSSNSSSRSSLHIVTDPDALPLLATDTDSLADQMGRRSNSLSDDDDDSAAAKSRRPNGASNGHTNGHATGAMANSLLEHRRKHIADVDDDSPTASESHTTRLLNLSSFTLDDPVPALPHERDPRSKGFTKLPEKDKRNFLLLVLLYFLQGLPMGLAMGSVPFLLKEHVSYAQMGVFSLASYPYSLKLLWSPIVDAVWSPRLGRRKSWILPIQTLSGLGMIWLAGNVQGMLVHAGENGGNNVWGFTWWWFALVFMCATQDIAVDGWALTLLSTDNLSYASTAQTVGLTGGQFLSSTVFLAFNSKDFANKWFRTIPGDTGLISLGGMLAFSGWLYLLVTLGLTVLKREELTKNEDGVWDTYKVMVNILKMKNIQALIIVHLIAKIGFQANDGATTLKLIDKKFGQDNLALTVLIDFPFEIGLGYYVGKWSSVYPPMQLWSWAFMGRLAAAGLAQFIVWVFPATGVTPGFLLLVIVGHVFSTFMNTVMFVAVSAFHAKIADPVYGGTYMTLLATVSNLGGTFPKFFVLKLIDVLTIATCTPPSTPAPASDLLKGPPITSPFSCVAEPDKLRCSNGGGVCTITTDGYYIVNVLCILVGVLTFWGWIKPVVKGLQALPVRAWRFGGEAR